MSIGVILYGLGTLALIAMLIWVNHMLKKLDKPLDSPKGAREQ